MREGGGGSQGGGKRKGDVCVDNISIARRERKYHRLSPSPDHVGCYGSHAVVVVVLGGELLREVSVGGDNLD